MSASAQPEPEFRPVKSAGRALDVIEALAVAPCTLSELSRRLDIPKSSLHGVLRTLTARRWVRQLDGVRFALGLRAWQVGAAFLSDDPAVVATAAALDQLAEATGETVQHARLDGDAVVYLAKRDSRHPVGLISALGTRLPAHTTALGKALLAARPDEAVRAALTFPLPALTAHARTTWEELRSDLAEIRERGYAVDDEEAAEGLRCLAVTVPNGGTPVDALSVSVPAYRLPDSRLPDIVDALRAAQAALGAASLPRP